MRGVRVLILACASVAAMASMWLMRGAIESRANVPAPAIAAAQAPAPVAQPGVETPRTVDILVAAKDIPIGRTLARDDVKWQAFPAESTTPYFFVKQEDENALDTIMGAASRVSFRAGEPLSTEKIIDLNGSGVMAALLRKGMRAVAVPISDITGAGGFILPGDFVDLLLTRQISVEEFNPSTGEIDRTVTHNQTDTVMSTVRVLAIDQRIAERDGEGTSAVGNTATIELTPDQVELISLTRQIAKQERGFLTLSLRSFAELVEEYGEDVERILPRTELDLQALARAKIKRANEMREMAEGFRAEQRAYELERRKRLEAEEMRQNTAALAPADPVTVDTVPAPEDDGIVLVRNGAPIMVRTTSGQNTEAGR